MKGTDFTVGSPAGTLTNIESAEECQLRCELTRNCFYFTYHTINKNCWLIHWIGDEIHEEDRHKPYISGRKRCAQGEYGASWDFPRRKDGQDVENIAGCPNTELCQRMCLATASCDEWTFNFKTYQCHVYNKYGQHRTFTKSTNLKRHRDTLENTPWVSGPRHLL